MAALRGMKAICQYMGRSEATMLSIIRDMDFPARKIGGIWESDTIVVDDWLVAQVKNGTNGEGKKEGNVAAE